MRIVVIGDGKVGRTIVSHLASEGHTVVVIDKNPDVIEQVVEQYDVMGICGNGAIYDIQKSAKVDKADLVIAATSSDEINVLSCVIAKQLGAKATVARVRSYEYDEQVYAMTKYLGLNMTINPEREAANEIMNIINFPQAIRVDMFCQGRAEIVEMYIPENSPLVGQSLSAIHAKYQIQMLVCAVQRGEEVYIPDGNFVLQAKDKIHITARRAEIKDFLTRLGLMQNKIKDVMIIGGGKVSVYLAKRLLKSKYNVKIIEKDYDKCVALSNLLPTAKIIHGDGSDQELLLDEGITNIGAIVSLTNLDEENIIISMYANKQKANKIIAKINKSSLIGLLETLDMASIVSPKEVTASSILSYVRAMNNSRGSHVETLYKLVNNEVEAVEFNVRENSKAVNVCLKDLKLKKNILIALIIRDDRVIVPGGNDQILLHDKVIVISKNHYLDDLKDILV